MNMMPITHGLTFGSAHGRRGLVGFSYGSRIPRRLRVWTCAWVNCRSKKNYNFFPECFFSGMVGVNQSIISQKDHSLSSFYFWYVRISAAVTIAGTRGVVTIGTYGPSVKILIHPIHKVCHLNLPLRVPFLKEIGDFVRELTV